jgi:hypothetical protein
MRPSLPAEVPAPIEADAWSLDWVALTSRGRVALDDYAQALRGLLNGL